MSNRPPPFDTNDRRYGSVRAHRHALVDLAPDRAVEHVGLSAVEELGEWRVLVEGDPLEGVAGGDGGARVESRGHERSEVVQAGTGTEEGHAAQEHSFGRRHGREVVVQLQREAARDLVPRVHAQLLVERVQLRKVVVRRERSGVAEPQPVVACPVLAVQHGREDGDRIPGRLRTLACEDDVVVPGVREHERGCHRPARRLPRVGGGTELSPGRRRGGDGDEREHEREGLDGAHDALATGR